MDNKYAQKPVQYTALGNSLTVGVGSGYTPGYVQRYKRFAEQALQQNVCLSVVARSGATSGQVLRFLKHPQIRHLLKESSIISISAGGNDLIQAAKLMLQTKNEAGMKEALAEGKKNVSEILKEIREIKADPKAKNPYIIRMLDIYNPFSELPLAAKWVQGMNAHLRSLTSSTIRITNLYAAFKGREKELLSADKIHPNPQGYQVIAEELNRLGYSPLAPSR